MLVIRVRERVTKAKKVRTTSDDPGGKSVSEKSKSMGGKCVSENSTGGKTGHGQVTTPSSRQELRSRNTSLM